MNANQIMKIFEDTAYVRMGGTEEELKTAQYLAGLIGELGLKAEIVPFEVPMATMQEAVLTVDGETVVCKGYLNAGSHEVEAPFYYLRHTDAFGSFRDNLRLFIAAAREKGLVGMEGKEYVVKDGDVILFRFNV